MNSLAVLPNIDVRFVTGAISFSLLWDFVSFVNLAILFSYAVHMLSARDPISKNMFLSQIYPFNFH